LGSQKSKDFSNNFSLTDINAEIEKNKAKLEKLSSKAAKVEVRSESVSSNASQALSSKAAGIEVCNEPVSSNASQAGPIEIFAFRDIDRLVAGMMKDEVKEAEIELRGRAGTTKYSVILGHINEDGKRSVTIKNTDEISREAYARCGIADDNLIEETVTGNPNRLVPVVLQFPRDAKSEDIFEIVKQEEILLLDLQRDSEKLAMASTGIMGEDIVKAMDGNVYGGDGMEFENFSETQDEEPYIPGRTQSERENSAKGKREGIYESE
jgi:hypothetical protein